MSASLKPFTANFAAAYAVCGVVGPMLAQNPLTLDVLTICASSAACSMGKGAATVINPVPANCERSSIHRVTPPQTRRHRQCLHC